MFWDPLPFLLLNFKHKVKSLDVFQSVEIVDQPGLDVFGQVYNQWKNKECVCPNCSRSIAASRFAPHLEKCLGMGRNSSRIANRRYESITSKGLLCLLKWKQIHPFTKLNYDCTLSSNVIIHALLDKIYKGIKNVNYRWSSEVLRVHIVGFL